MLLGHHVVIPYEIHFVLLFLVLEFHCQ